MSDLNINARDHEYTEWTLYKYFAVSSRIDRCTWNSKTTQSLFVCLYVNLTYMQNAPNIREVRSILFANPSKACILWNLIKCCLKTESIYIGRAFWRKNALVGLFITNINIKRSEMVLIMKFLIEIINNF